MIAVRRIARALREAIGEASWQLPLPGGSATISFGEKPGAPRIVDGHIAVDRRHYGPRAGAGGAPEASRCGVK